MISSAISATSGLNAMAFIRGKSETGGLSTSQNRPHPEVYWTPERMQDAIPRNMEIETPKPEADPKVPDDSEGQGDAKPGFAPGFAPEGKTQLEDYWTAGNMQDAMPPNMEIDIPEPAEDPKTPADGNPVFATADGLQSEEYWTSERMRDAVARDMEIEIPEPEADSKISANVNPVIATENGPGTEEYWTPARMRDAIARDMGIEPTHFTHAQPRTAGSDLIQKYQQFWAAEWQQTVKILA